ncbi:MAG: hypothetical protein LBL73_05385 [Synergistaceae bacterium]|jgi:hypothetical protein|nr:hypothetical protein [Synergistaceae bacterium]
MSSIRVQNALTEFGQVDVLIEMVVKHLTGSPDDIRDIGWYVSMENALYLLEQTYRAKKTALVSALEGGEINE